METRFKNSPSIFLLVLIGCFCFEQAAVLAADHPPLPGIGEIRTALDKTAPAPTYRMYALRVGVAQNTRRNLLIRDPSLPPRIPAAFSFWVIKGADRIILIDTGFTNRAMISKWGIEHYRTPLSLLDDIGIQGKDVTDVVVTHRHWDHLGAIHQFPSARLWISKGEYRAIGGARGKHRPKSFRLAKREGRLRIIDKVRAMAPGVALVPVGLHTTGFQFVAVKTGTGITVFSSDVAPLWSNFERGIPSGQTDNPAQTLALQELILKLVDNRLECIVPGHEPRVYRGGPIQEILSSHESPFRQF